VQLYEIDGLPSPIEIPQILVIGKFDGVHIGHQAILDQAKTYLQPGMRLAVMCFEPHPSFVLTGDKSYAQLLTPRKEKMRTLSDYGVDALYIAPFDERFSSIEAEAFVRDYLSPLCLRRIVVGPDFRFGRGGRGDVDALTRLGQEMGIEVTVVSPVEENGVKVSSSQIRSHLGEGRVEAVEALLGRPYAVTGVVVHGDKRGRTIGFPTINLGDTAEYVRPKGGVYAVSVQISSANGGKEHWFGVMNAGYRPTVSGTDYRMEVHLLGFTGDLYGQECRVSLLQRIRDEQKFSSLDALKSQIEEDCRVARTLLGLPQAEN
jgi:riboflavin kinase / FMN adenylyltransferase